MTGKYNYHNPKGEAPWLSGSGSLMVRKAPGSKSAEGQKYHVTCVLYLGKALYQFYSHLLHST